MPRRKSTLRRMSPAARDLARLQDELKSVARRLDRIIRLVQEAELYASAWTKEAQRQLREQQDKDQGR